MANDSHGFFAGGAPYFGFTQVGTTITGTISEEPHTQQQTDPQTGELKTWQNGDPMLVLVVPLQTDLRNSQGLVTPVADDDGSRTVWVGSQGMRKAIQSALKASGATGLDMGGQLTVTYIGDAERTNPKLNPPKIFSAHYVPPNPSQQYFTDPGSDAQYAQSPGQQAAQIPGAGGGWITGADGKPVYSYPVQPQPPAPQYAPPAPQAPQYVPQYAPPAPQAPPAQQLPAALQGLTPEQVQAVLAMQGVGSQQIPNGQPQAPVQAPIAGQVQQNPVAPPSATAQAAPPVNLPPGMSPEMWNQLTPEARAALASISR